MEIHDNLIDCPSSIFDEEKAKEIDEIVSKNKK